MMVQAAYNRWASSYDSDTNRTRDLDERVTAQLLAGQHSERTLEIGCGTGKNTRFYAQISRQVLAVDFSAAMLRNARRKTQAANVMFGIVDLTRAWPCRAAAVDRIVCNLVLEHIADLSFIFSEAQRALQPGGTFFISELHPFRQYQGTKANFQAGEQHIEIPAYVHHISDFLKAGAVHGFRIADLQEWWHPEDENKPPRILTMIFSKVSQIG